VRTAHTVAVVAALGISFGCHKTLSTRVVQPNPLCQPLETLRQSEPAVIVTGDHELRSPRAARTNGSLVGSDRIPLRNVATFSVVSRDRLRFRVQVEHKWEEWADVTTWNAELVDDLGNHYRPEDVLLVANQHVVQMWDHELRTVQRNRFGDITRINDDGYKDRQPLGSVSHHRGTATVAFYARDIFSPEVRSLTLFLRRSGQSLKFRWDFTDAASGGEIFVDDDGHRRRRSTLDCTVASAMP
jgi:hypothetical protein